MKHAPATLGREIANVKAAVARVRRRTLPNVRNGRRRWRLQWQQLVQHVKVPSALALLLLTNCTHIGVLCRRGTIIYLCVLSDQGLETEVPLHIDQ